MSIRCVPWAPWPRLDVSVRIRPTCDLRGPYCGNVKLASGRFAYAEPRDLFLLRGTKITVPVRQASWAARMHSRMLRGENIPFLRLAKDGK